MEKTLSGKYDVDISMKTPEIIRKKLVEPSERIFPPPSFLFEVKEDRKYNERKANYTTFNSFKPKLEVRPVREGTGQGIRSKNKEKRRLTELKMLKSEKNTMGSMRNEV